MTIEKAIQVLEELEPLTTRYLHREYEKAVKLGIEGLKLIQYQSPDRTLPGTKLLPGETEK